MFADGTAVVEFVAKPSELLSDEPVDIRVRFKLSGNSKSGPWDVNSLALFDDDPIINDKIAEIGSLQITSQDRWYYHTFQGVDLVDHVDWANGSVELFARVKIDDNRLNGVDAKDSTPVYDIQAYSDLTASNIRVSDTTVEPGQQIWVHFDVTNDGLALAKASETGIMFSNNSSITTSDRLLEKEWLWRLGAGNTNAESRLVKIPEDAVIGDTYYIGTIVDYNNDNREGSGERNNGAAAARAVTIVDPRADLVVNAISVEHRASDALVDIVSPGQKVKLNTQIGNVGNSRASLFNLEFYWSSTPNGTTQKVADNWIATVGAGNTNHEWDWYTIGDVPSGTYYITVAVDSEHEVHEIDEANNRLSIPIEVYNPKTPIDFDPGVTIITAGFQGTGTENGQPQKYTMEMAARILERAYGENTLRGSVFISDPHTGQWVNPNERFDNGPVNDACNTLSVYLCSNPFASWRENSNDPNDEIVLIYDWSWESNIIDKGWNEAAGDNLFASLAKDFPIGDESINLLDRPLHFIGASRGTVVNTHAARRIDEYFPDVSIDHFTTLDPHPAKGPLGSIGDYGSDVKKLILPDNIVYADNFFRQDLFYEGLDLDFNGVEVPGAVNLRLDEDTLSNSGAILEHVDVHIWYTATISPNAGKIEGKNVDSILYNDWWVSGRGFDDRVEDLSGRALTGYAYSRIGGRPQAHDQIDHAEFTFSTQPESVFNGDFRYGNRVTDNIPGWERHGGGGGGNLDGTGVRYLQLDQDDTTRIHNLMYFPADTSAIEFDWLVNQASPEDRLRVSVGDQTLAEFPVASTHEQFEELTVPLSFDHDGFVDSLSFVLIPPSGQAVDAGVRIDNVRLTNRVVAVPPVDQPPCDVTGEGLCDAGDIDALFAAIRANAYLPEGDYNNDGASTSADADIWIHELMATHRGDANLDRSVDFSDFLVLSANFGNTAGWGEGDFDGDGVAAFSDFLLLSQNFGRSA